MVAAEVDMTMRRALRLMAAVAVCALAGAPAVAQEAEAAIAAVNVTLQEAVAAGDIDAIVSVYTADAVVMAPNAPALEGREAIRAYMQSMLDMGVGSLELSTDELTVQGDTAYEIGRYVMGATDGAHLDHGKFIVIWSRTDDGWKLHRDMFNSDMSPAGE